MTRKKTLSPQVASLKPIGIEIDKVIAELRSQIKEAPAKRQKTLKLRIKLLERSRDDLFEFFMC